MLIESIHPDGGQGTRGVFSPAKKIDLGDCYMVLVSGQQASKNENNEAFTDDIEKQTEDVFQSIDKILKAAGGGVNDIVKSQIYLTDLNDFKKISPIRDKWFAQCKPTSTLLEVNGFTRKGAKIEIEVTAIIKK